MVAECFKYSLVYLSTSLEIRSDIQFKQLRTILIVEICQETAGKHRYPSLKTFVPGFETNGRKPTGWLLAQIDI